MKFIYLFEAKGIQRYIADSSKMKDGIGASEIIFQLARSDGRDLVQIVLDVLGFNENHVQFSRRASAAFMAAGNEEHIYKFRQLWRIVFQLAAPGVEFSDVINPVKDTYLNAMKACYRAGPAVRENSIVSNLPLATPYCEFVPRTGRAKTTFRTEDPDDPLDQITLPQTRAFQALKGEHREGVASRFLPEDIDSNFVFPRNMEADDNSSDSKENPIFPFIGDNKWIALVHADISGLGQVWQEISRAFGDEDDISTLGSISAEIEKAISGAAQEATRSILLEQADCNRSYDKYVLPARPLVLGGDDLTLIVRADLALKYTKVLLEQIEIKTKQAFSDLKTEINWLEKADLPTHLSACAGVAYAKANQPHAMANALAEGLCKYAKKDAKHERQAPYPSGISFHVIQTSLQEEYDSIIEQELILKTGKLLISHPFFLGVKAEAQELSLPHYDQFAKLIQIFKENRGGIGKLKTVKSELMGSEAIARKVWKRWREIFQQTSGEAKLKEFDNILIKLGVKSPDDLPFDERNKSPIFDAMAIADLEKISDVKINEAA